MNAKQISRKMKVRLSFHDKLEIIESINSNIPTNVICTKYNIHKCTVTRIKKDRERILEFTEQANIPNTKIKRLTNVSVPETEKALYIWFLNERAMQNPVSDNMLQLKGLEFHKELNSNIPFEASAGWIQKFKKRHGIRLLKVCGEKLSCNDSAVPLFIDSFINLLQDQDVVPDQIYNADETGLVYKFLNNTTLVSCNEKCAAGRKKSIERITIMPCTNATGSHKLPLMIIGKSKNPRCFKNVTFPKLHYRSSRNAWQTQALFKEWFFDIFIPEVCTFLSSKNLPKKAILLLDNATAHFYEDTLRSEDGNIRVHFLPPNTTALLQPLDQHVIKTMKQIYRKKLLLDLISKPGTDLNEKLNTFNLKEVLFLISEAWNEVKETVITSAFQQILPKQGTQNVLVNVTDLDDGLFVNNNVSLPNLYKQVVSDTYLTDDGIMDWASGKNEISTNLITDEDILDDIRQSTDKEEKLHSETDIKDVIKGLNVSIDYAERHLNIEDILMLRKIREKIILNSI